MSSAPGSDPKSPSRYRIPGIWGNSGILGILGDFLGFLRDFGGGFGDFLGIFGGGSPAQPQGQIQNRLPGAEFREFGEIREFWEFWGDFWAILGILGEFLGILGGFLGDFLGVVHELSHRVRSKIAFQVQNSGNLGKFGNFGNFWGDFLGFLRDFGDFWGIFWGFLGVVHELSNRVRSKIAFQTQQSKFVNWQVDGEYRGGDFTAALTLGNPDILMGSGILVCHYLQSVTPSLALGAELVYHRRPGEEGAVLSLAGRYSAPAWIGTVTLGQAGAHLTYYHRASEQLQVGVEFEASTRLQDSSVAFGYQLELPRGNLLFRGSLDSSWQVGAVLEKKLPPLPLTLALGAFINHRKEKFHCGFGLTIG
uniref:Uncharacterized protein n=1 Tax=Geospiza parvula TaxID=87175 RepID=A0A8U8C343_GEOPR